MLLHDFERGELVLEGLGEGLNVVWAPNAVGKSTLAKAIGIIFDPGKCDPKASVDAIVVDDRGKRRVSSHRKGLRFPGFAGEYDQYQLDLLDMLNGFKGRRSPIDDELGEGMEFKAAPPPTAKSRFTEVVDALDARNELDKARIQKARVAGDEDRIPELRVQVEAARQARAQVQALEQLQRFLGAQEELATLRDGLADALVKEPGVLDQSPDACPHATTLLENLESTRAAVEEANVRLAEFAPEGPHPPGPLTEADRSALKLALTELTEARSVLRTAQQRTLQETARAKTARDQAILLTKDASPDDLPAPTEEQLRELVAAAGRADAARMDGIRMNAYSGMLEDWRATHPPMSDQSERELRGLLDGTGAKPPGDRRAPMLLALAVLAAGGLVASSDSVIRLVLALVALSAGAAAWFFLRPRIEARAGSAAPRIEELLSQKAAASVERDLESRSKVSGATFDWAAVSKDLAIRCQDPYQLATVATTLSAYVIAREEALVAEETERHAKDRVNDAAVAIAALVGRYGFPNEPGPEEATSEAFLGWFDAAANLERERDRLGKAEAGLRRHLAANGLPATGDLAEAVADLKRREPLAKMCREVRNRIQHLEGDVKAIELQHDTLQSVLETAEPTEVTASEISAALARLRGVDRELDERQEALSKAVLKVEQAEVATLPEKTDAYEQALGKVELKWHGLVREAMRYRIGQCVQERLRTTELPEVVRIASDHLRSFTDDRFSLEIASAPNEGGLGVLIVRDSQRDKMEFDRLSTGTKVHAVIAIRLAVIDAQERKAAGPGGDPGRFPLVADEALAVSDPVASRAIAETLAQVAKQRQVIVFTNQTEDIELFKRVDSRVNLVTLGGELPGHEGGRSKKPRAVVVKSTADGQPVLGL